MAKVTVLKVSSKNAAYAKVKISNGIIGGKVGWTWIDQDLAVGQSVDVADILYTNCVVNEVPLENGKIAKTLKW